MSTTPFPLAIAAWAGGRSWSEARSEGAQELPTSIRVGLSLLILTFPMVLVGWTLFLGSTPAFADHAFWWALLAALMMALFYGLCVRALERSGTVGKICYWVAALCLVSVNTLLAGHEFVLRIFDAQVQAVMASKGNQAVSTYNAELSTRLGLQGLNQQQNQLENRQSALETRLQQASPQAQQLDPPLASCRSAAESLRRNLPDRGSPSYRSALRGLTQKRTECARLQKERNAIQKQYVEQLRAELKTVTDRQASNVTKLGDAEAEYSRESAEKAPVMQAAANQGFARHSALWDAVAQGLVPRWAALGLMFVAMVLESLTLLLKFFQPPDKVAQLHRDDALMRASYASAYERNVVHLARSRGQQDASGQIGESHLKALGQELDLNRKTMRYQARWTDFFQAMTREPQPPSTAPEPNPVRHPS